MNWNDWEFVWKRQELPKGPDAEIEKLKAAFEAKHQQMRRALLVRDYSEMGAGVVVCVFLARVGWRLGAHGWPFVIVIALVLGVTAVFVRERWRARRAVMSPTASVLEKVEADLAELRHQKGLIGKVALWYIAPLYTAIVIGVVTLATAKPWFDPVLLSANLGFQTLVCGFAWWINHRALHQRIKPRLAELEKLHCDLRSNS